MKITFLLYTGLFMLLFSVASLGCQNLFLPSLSPDDLLKIYASRQFIDDKDVLNEVINTYHLDSPAQLDQYTHLLQDSIQNAADWDMFSQAAIQYYIQVDRKRKVEADFYRAETAKPKMNTFSFKLKISESDALMEEQYVKVKRRLVPVYNLAQDKWVTFMVECYKNQRLEYITYFSENKNKELMTNYYSEDGSIKETQYYDYADVKEYENKVQPMLDKSVAPHIVQ